MKSVLILLATGLYAYAIEIFLVGAFLAFCIERRKKEFSKIKLLPFLFIFFALNEMVYLPAVITSDVNFTINNHELAKFLEVSDGESLTGFVASDLFSFWIWFVESFLAYGVSMLLTRKTKPSPLDESK